MRRNRKAGGSGGGGRGGRSAWPHVVAVAREIAWRPNRKERTAGAWQGTQVRRGPGGEGGVSEAFGTEGGRWLQAGCAPGRRDAVRGPGPRVAARRRDFLVLLVARQGPGPRAAPRAAPPEVAEDSARYRFARQARRTGAAPHEGVVADKKSQPRTARCAALQCFSAAFLASLGSATYLNDPTRQRLDSGLVGGVPAEVVETCCGAPWPWGRPGPARTP